MTVRTLPIRRWLALSLLALFLAPMFTMGVIGFVVFRGQDTPWNTATDADKQLVADADQWPNPAWQESIRNDLTRGHTDVVLRIHGQEVYRTVDDPISIGGDTRTVREIAVPGVQPPHVALIYTDVRTGPPRELQQWFIPAALLSVVVLTLAGIAWFLRRSIVQPLTAASVAARQIADGELDISLPDSRVREIAELNAAFGAMSSDLKVALSRQATMEQERRLFISAIAHDLRTPLFSLRGSLEGLQMGIANTPEKRARYIAVAQTKADALERLIADLFTFTRMEYMDESPAIEDIDLAALMRGIADGATLRAGATGIRFVAEGVNNGLTMRGDAHLLTRVIENLLDNAFYHTPEGGTVWLTWQQSHTETAFSVADSGSGIAESDLPHLFEALYRGESSRNRQTGGAGLGLTIARRIVEAHGGMLTAANGADGGAVFTVTLPR